MKNPVIRLGKVGNVVWGRSRHGRTCYQLVIPTNPRTVGQQANRGTFGSVVSEWGRLREEYWEEWNEAGPRHQSRRTPRARAEQEAQTKAKGRNGLVDWWSNGLMDRWKGCWQAGRGLAEGAEGGGGGEFWGGSVLMRWHYGILSVAEQCGRRWGAVRAGP